MAGNIQRRYTMEMLHIFPDSNVPQDLLKNVSNQIKQLRPKPKRLDHYDEEYVKQYPKIIDYPSDYVLR